MVRLELAGDAFDASCQKNDRQNNQRHAEKNHERKLPGEVKAHGKAGDDRKRGLQIVRQPGVDRDCDLSCIADDAGGEASDIVLLIKAHRQGLDMLKILLAQVAADADGKELCRVAAGKEPDRFKDCDTKQDDDEGFDVIGELEMLSNFPTSQLSGLVSFAAM